MSDLRSAVGKRFNVGIALEYLLPFDGILGAEDPVRRLAGKINDSMLDSVAGQAVA